MALFTVTTANDVVDAGDGVLSLREAVAQANGTVAADKIQFASNVEGQTLVLTGGELVVGNDLAIVGDQDSSGPGTRLSGGYTRGNYEFAGSRVLHVVGNQTDIALTDMGITNGIGEYGIGGGGILLDAGSLTMSRCAVDNCASDGSNGGGIYAGSGTRVSITDSSFYGNEAGYFEAHGTGGGGIAGGNNVTLAIRGSTFFRNVSSSEFSDGGGAIRLLGGGRLVVEDSLIVRNSAVISGAILVNGGDVSIARSDISDNYSGFGGGIAAYNSRLAITESTIARNIASGLFDIEGVGGGLSLYNSDLILRNSTIAGNDTNVGGYGSPSRGGGIAARSSRLDIANSIVAANSAEDGPDISGAITASNGHNVFGSDVIGNIAGDREGVAESTLFTIGTTLRNSVANPALGGSLSFDAMSTDQGGIARPLPTGSQPDISAAELSQVLSKAPSNNNDALTGTSAANTISGLLGNDRIFGDAGNDTLNGNDGGDTFDSGAGNDKINGGTGVDIALYGGSTAIVFDLAATTDTVRQGTAVDTLTGIEGGAGGGGADTFRGDGNANRFRGGDGKDLYTGGGGRDVYDFNSLANSPAGGTLRDVVTDFAVGVDKLDFAGVDANALVARDQAFRFVGTAAFGTEPGVLGYFSSGGDTIVRGSVDADSTPEIEVQLTGIFNPALTATDFVL